MEKVNGKVDPTNGARKKKKACPEELHIGKPKGQKKENGSTSKITKVKGFKKKGKNVSLKHSK